MMKALGGVLCVKLKASGSGCDDIRDAINWGVWITRVGRYLEELAGKELSRVINEKY